MQSPIEWLRNISNGLDIDKIYTCTCDVCIVKQHNEDQNNKRKCKKCIVYSNTQNSIHWLRNNIDKQSLFCNFAEN